MLQAKSTDSKHKTDRKQTDRKQTDRKQSDCKQTDRKPTVFSQRFSYKMRVSARWLWNSKFFFIALLSQSLSFGLRSCISTVFCTNIFYLFILFIECDTMAPC